MSSFPPLFPLTLDGTRVRMEPLSHDHVEALVAATAGARDTFSLTQVPDGADAMHRYVDEALEAAAKGDAVPFATVDKARGCAVGSTRFANIERWQWPYDFAPLPPLPVGPDAVEIGWTWLGAAAQRTHINTEAKLLMIDHAFDVWKIRRLTLKTDARNARSRANIERVGCTLDGIWRAHMPAWDGTIRNTAFYSMLASEWPAARARLVARLRP